MSLPLVADSDLVARCRRGDQEAWNELVNRFSRYVYAITTRIYRLSQHDAEDVFQDVFARTYERLGDLRDDNAVRPWIATLTRRLCVDLLRASSREQPAEEPLDPAQTDDSFAQLDESLAVHEGLRALPEHCGEILDRFFARDESYRAIGDALGLPGGTIASRISRCLKKLRAELEGRTPRFQRGDENGEEENHASGRLEQHDDLIA
jgi:RNA polymerase sigma factor (sigma-70 family)